MNRRKKPLSSSLQFLKLEPRNLLASLTVDTLLDVVDESDGLMSLREAVLISNENDQYDVIRLPAGELKLEVLGIDEDAGLTGDLNVLSDNGNEVRIAGVGREHTIISGQIDRIFDLHGAQVTLLDLTLQEGIATSPEVTS